MGMGVLFRFIDMLGNWFIVVGLEVFCVFFFWMVKK